MKLIETAAYGSVILVALAVLFGAFEGGTDTATRAFVCCMVAFFAGIEIFETWKGRP